MTDQSNDKPAADATITATEEQRLQSAQGWLQAMRAKLGLSGPQTLRDTIEGALKAPDPAATFTEAERKMLERLLRFGTSRVAAVMVPRADIISLDENEPLSELLRTFNEAGVSRIPLYRENLDDPRGMIHVKDVFGWLMAEATGRHVKSDKPEKFEKSEKIGKLAQNGNGDPNEIPMPDRLDLSHVDLTRPITTAKIRRQVLYVPPSMPAADLLIRMQTTRIHMALIVDEYGGTDGLVTIEDLVEQIVGDIEDEHDTDEAKLIIPRKDGEFDASARADLEEVEKAVGFSLVDEEEAEEIDTLAGLVFSLVGRVPQRGEIVAHPAGVEFEVLDADPRRLKRLRVRVTKPKDAEDAAEDRKPAAVVNG